MFEKFLSDNVENFAQRYMGTFGFYRDAERRRMLVKLVDVNNTRCDFVDANGITFHVFPDAAQDVGFEFLPPRSSWYNTKEGAMYTERVAQRQFSRGINAKNTMLYLLRDGAPTPVKVDFKNLSAVFEAPEDTSQFISALDKKQSFALSPQFALDPLGPVWLYREQVGKFSKKGSHFIFSLNEPSLWKTEITDALKAIGCTAEIA